MTYVKWTGNRLSGDNTEHLILRDGTEVHRGVPVDLKADLRKELEGNYIFEDSSAEEAKEMAENPDAQQPVGVDVVGTAPIFKNNPTSQADQTSDTDQGGSSRSRS